VRPPREERQPRAAEIGGRIAQARNDSGWTNITRFAAEIGSDRNSVGRWERGEVLPDALSIEAVSRVTGRSADWILRGDPSPGWTAAIEAWRATPTESSSFGAVDRLFSSLPPARRLPAVGPSRGRRERIAARAPSGALLRSVEGTPFGA